MSSNDRYEYGPAGRPTFSPDDLGPSLVPVDADGNPIMVRAGTEIVSVTLTIPCCATCQHWNRSVGGWGYCNLIDLTHHNDAQIVGAASSKARLCTIAAFGCSEHVARPLTSEDPT